MIQSLDQKAINLHRQYQGKLGVAALFPVQNPQELALVYTPGVAAVSKAIKDDASQSFDLTSRGRTIAVVSDGSAVLGLGKIGPEAAMPVMEGKSLLMKVFAGVDSIPLVIDTTKSDQIIQFIKMLRPAVAGVNLEDVAAPVCFEVEEALQDIGIPVFHDDQHGTAIVVMAALQNAAKVVKKDFSKLKVVVVGAGAAGLAISKILLGLTCQAESCQRISGANRVADLIVVDSQGALVDGRSQMNIYKQAVAKLSNNERRSGSLANVIEKADVVIGVSGPGNISTNHIKKMSKNAIVFALANPIPEIMPDEAMRAGASVVATGRSDFPNQINNVLAFPGIFRAVIDNRLPIINYSMKLAASTALANLIKNPTSDSILPSVFNEQVAPAVAKAVKDAYVS